MQWLTRSDSILLAIATYVAIMALVRLMRRRRDALVSDVQRQMEAYRKRPKRAAADKSKRDAA